MHACGSSSKRNRAMKLKTFIVLSCLAIVATGCDAVGDNEPGPSVSGIFVVNQGNFTDANGSVTVFEAGDEPRPAGEIRGLGSILQSAAVIDDQLYLMANTAGRIDVINTETLEQTAQIIGLVSPRYMVAEGRTAYVTNLFESPNSFTGGNVTVVDLTTNKKVKEIPVGNHPEGLAIVDDRLFVANSAFGKGSTVNVIDLSTQTVVDTIDVECDGPRAVVADADEDVFVFCTGEPLYDDEFNPIGSTDGAVRILDGASGEIVKRISVNGALGTTGPGQDAFHAEESGRIYVVKGANTVLVFDTSSNSQVDAIGPFEGDPIGAVAFDEERRLLYLGRVPGFDKAGTVTIHSDDGTQIESLTAGVAPTFIAFK